MSDEQKPKPAEKTDAPSPMEGKKVLVVEDDPGGLEMLEGLLSKRGCSVLKAANGQEGIEAARSMGPDLIVADVIMPEKDGFELLKELRGNDATKQIPVVFVSARKNMAESLLVSGADAFFSKPLDTSEFLTKVEALVLRPRPSSGPAGKEPQDPSGGAKA